jgi:hypothetical protein
MSEDHLGSMALVPTSPDIEFWTLDEHTTEAVREALERSPPRLSLPIIWDGAERPSDGRYGPAVADPLTIYLDLPFGANEDDEVHYACTLEELVDYMIDAHREGDVPEGTVSDPEAQEICARVSARLRELADKIDAACQSAAPGADDPLERAVERVEGVNARLREKVKILEAELRVTKKIALQNVSEQSTEIARLRAEVNAKSNQIVELQTELARQ